MRAAAKKRQVLGNIEITGILTDKRQLRASGLIYSDDTPEHLNKRLWTCCRT